MPELSLENAFQVAVLVAGVYLVLSLLRTTRGSGLVRAVGIGLLIFGVGMYSLVRTLQLDELEQVLDAIFGVVIIVGVVLFQPELRRGLLRLGEQGFLRRFFAADTTETIGEIVAAVARMAPVKQGALIAIERQAPLDEYVEKGVRLDAAVSRQLIDSIFYDKGALHDGAVIIQGDRIVAAAAILPLSENSALAKTTGTRHRAALGLAETTDAVTVVVSEETGWISVAHDGKMLSRVASNALEDVLQEHLGKGDSTENQRRSVLALARDAFTAHWGQKLISLALGITLFIAAHKKVTETEEFVVQVEAAAPNTPVGAPQADRLAIYPPSRSAGDTQELHIAAPVQDQPVSILVTGSRAQMQELVGGIGGVLELTEETATNRPLSAEEFHWGTGRAFDGLKVRWKDEAPQLVLQNFERRQLPATAQAVALELDALPKHIGILEDSLTVRPSTVEVRGPSDAFAPEGEPFTLRFAPVQVRYAGSTSWSGSLVLAEELREQGFELLEDVDVEVQFESIYRPLGEIKKDVILLSIDPTKPAPEERFERPEKQVRLQVRVLPLLENPSEEDRTSLAIALRDHIDSKTFVYVDVGPIEPGGSTLAEVELKIVDDASWFEALPPTLREGIDRQGPFPFRVTVHPDDKVLRLTPRSRTDGSSNPDPQD